MQDQGLPLCGLYQDVHQGKNKTRPEVVNRCDSRFMTGFKTEFVTGHTHDSIHDRIHDGIHESEH